MTATFLQNHFGKKVQVGQAYECAGEFWRVTEVRGFGRYVFGDKDADEIRIDVNTKQGRTHAEMLYHKPKMDLGVAA